MDPPGARVKTAAAPSFAQEVARDVLTALGPPGFYVISQSKYLAGSPNEAEWETVLADESTQQSMKFRTLRDALVVVLYNTVTEKWTRHYAKNHATNHHLSCADVLSMLNKGEKPPPGLRTAELEAMIAKAKHHCREMARLNGEDAFYNTFDAVYTPLGADTRYFSG